jgi:predicted enzyme related to lactoylglutathione lyase
MQHLFTAAGMAFFSLGDVRLMLGQASGTEQSPCPTFLYYRVDDIHAAYETLKRRGVTPFEEPEMAYSAGGVELWLAIVKDMDGNLVALMCEKKAAA